MIRPETDLPSGLKEQFNFSPDPTGQWLQSDDFGHVSIGGILEGEWLPTRARVSADGTRFQIGARIVDFKGLIELSRITRLKRILSTDEAYNNILNFWSGLAENNLSSGDSNPVVQVTEEDDILFMGIEVKPTARGLETRFSEVGFSYDAALHATIEGKSFDQMLKDDWYGDSIKRLLKPRQEGEGGYSVIFSYDRAESEATEGSTCPVVPLITADTLQDYPLGSVWYGLHDTPGRFRSLGMEKEFKKGSAIVIQPGRPNVLDGSRMVEIRLPKLGDATMTIFLQIPEDVEIQTIDDLKKLTTAETFVKVGEGGTAVSRTEVAVTVENDSLRIISADQGLEIELGKPCCPECKIPTWKYPDSHDLIDHQGSNKSPSEWGDYAFLYGYHAGGGLGPRFNPFFGKYEGEEAEICGNCIIPAVEGFIKEHPLAARSRAIEVTRQKLDELGYPDIQIWENQVWRAGFEYPGVNGWEIYTKLEYERDGRKIMRHTGIPLLKDDGTFEPNLLPDEYIKFRYQTS